MANDENKVQPVTEPEGVNAQPATEQTGEAAQPATEQPSQEQVPFNEHPRFKELIEEKNALKGEVDSLRSQISLVQANMQQPQAPADPLAEYGIEADEPYVTPQQLKAVVAGETRKVQQLTSQQAFLSSHPDFSEVVGGATPSAALELALAKDPALRLELTNLTATNPAGACRFAYAIAKPEHERLKQPPPKPTTAPGVDQAIANANRVISSAAVGGASALNMASQIAKESSEDFEARVRGVKAGA